MGLHLQQACHTTATSSQEPSRWEEREPILLTDRVQDTVTRYAHQTGHHVERRFGWDCHGLPIEFEIDKELGVKVHMLSIPPLTKFKTREDVLKMGIPRYNAACRYSIFFQTTDWLFRAIVMRYSSEWEKIVKRLGRWIDFKNDYKTLDKDFMESVWWVFKQIYEKGLVYRGFKVVVSCSSLLCLQGDAILHCVHHSIVQFWSQPGLQGSDWSSYNCGISTWRVSKCFFTGLDHYSMDTSEQFGPLCQPWFRLCESIW